MELKPYLNQYFSQSNDIPLPSNIPIPITIPQLPFVKFVENTDIRCKKKKQYQHFFFFPLVKECIMSVHLIPVIGDRSFKSTQLQLYSLTPCYDEMEGNYSGRIFMLSMMWNIKNLNGNFPLEQSMMMRQ